MEFLRAFDQMFELILWFCLGLVIVGCVAILVFASTNNNNNNMSLDCIRMFYSDTWNKGYVEDLAEYCNNNNNNNIKK